MLEVCILGTGGTMPSPERWLSSCIMRCNGANMLIDCGEGTQISLKKCGYNFKPIDLICFTHFHADHISGLPGLLLSMGKEGRTEPLTVAGPVGVEEIVNSLRIIAPNLPFEIVFKELVDPCESFCVGDFHVTAFSVDHTVDCFGYTVEIKRARAFDLEKAKKNNVPIKIWGALQKNETAVFEGAVYNCDMVLGEQRKGIKVCYSTDTRPVETIVQNAYRADLFVCEGMYPDDTKQEKAEENKHMTFIEAADLAKKAEVEQLWLTHFSPSLPDPENYIFAAQDIFSNVKVSSDGMKIKLCFEE